jgi:hypothetical protein
MGREIVQVAALFLKTMPAERELAKRALEHIKKANRLTGWIVRRHARDFAPAFVAPVAGEGWIAPIEVWEQMLTHLKQVRACCEVIERFEQSRPLSSNFKVLTSVFVTQMAQFYQRQTGKPVPRSKSGPFVAFLDAAWHDLDFSSSIPLGALGNIAQKLPR